MPAMPLAEPADHGQTNLIIEDAAVEKSVMEPISAIATLLGCRKNPIILAVALAPTIFQQ
jgi:hypothetical protein